MVNVTTPAQYFHVLRRQVAPYNPNPNPSPNPKPSPDPDPDPNPNLILTLTLTLEKAADVLLHDTAWLPATAKKARPHLTLTLPSP